MSTRQPFKWWLLALAPLAGCATRFGAAGDRAFEVSATWIHGRPAVAWYGGHLAHEALFLRLADPDGRPAGPPLQLTDASRDAFEPSLQELQGDALVAWYEQESGAQGAPALQVALLARFDATGRKIWQQQLSAPASRGRLPVVRVQGQIIHVAWLEQQADAVPMLRVASLDAAGNWLRPPRDAGTAGRETWNLNAAVSPGGMLHVVFDSGEDSAKELHWVIVREAGIERRRVEGDDGHHSVFPDIALDGSRYAITWVDSRDGNDEVYLRCSNLDDSGSPAAMAPGFDGARRITHTTAASMGAYAVWHEGRLELAWIEGDGDHRELWRQSFDRGCEPLSAPKHVAGWGQAGIPSLAASPQGLALAWNGLRGPSSVVLLKVWPRRAAVSPVAAAR